jgi:multidrug efflux pump subunit AcrA (membrane-fusion protein)
MSLARIEFGDKVRVRTTSYTEANGIAGLAGVVYGLTAPSQTGVQVVGDTAADYAVAVMVEGKISPIWLAENLLELVDRQPGTIVQIGNSRLVRDEQGRWQEVKLI